MQINKKDIRERVAKFRLKSHVLLNLTRSDDYREGYAEGFMMALSQELGEDSFPEILHAWTDFDKLEDFMIPLVQSRNEEDRIIKETKEKFPKIDDSTIEMHYSFLLFALGQGVLPE